jgi:hypothetical protein
MQYSSQLMLLLLALCPQLFAPTSIYCKYLGDIGRQGVIGLEHAMVVNSVEVLLVRNYGLMIESAKKEAVDFNLQRLSKLQQQAAGCRVATPPPLMAQRIKSSKKFFHFLSPSSLRAFRFSDFKASLYLEQVPIVPVRLPWQLVSGCYWLFMAGWLLLLLVSWQLVIPALYAA